MTDTLRRNPKPCLGVLSYRGEPDEEQRLQAAEARWFKSSIVARLEHRLRWKMSQENWQRQDFAKHPDFPRYEKANMK
jgi:hypothetical protein